MYPDDEGSLEVIPPEQLEASKNVMNLTELKNRPAAALVELGESLGVENMARSRKQDIIFSILKAHAKNGESIFGNGVLEILQDGFGFLRDLGDRRNVRALHRRVCRSLGQDQRSVVAHRCGDVIRVRRIGKCVFDADLAEIYERIHQVEVERSYRIMGALDHIASDIENVVIPRLSGILNRWMKAVLITDAAVIGGILIAMIRKRPDSFSIQPSEQANLNSLMTVNTATSKQMTASTRIISLTLEFPVHIRFD